MIVVNLQSTTLHHALLTHDGLRYVRKILGVHKLGQNLLGLKFRHDVV